MEVAFGIALGVSAVETLVIAGVIFVFFTAPDSSKWEEHRRRATERVRAWNVQWTNGHADNVNE